MNEQKSPAQLWEAISQLLCCRKTMPIAPELQSALNECKTMEELKELLFSLQDKDEAVIRAFDRRIDQLDGTA